LRLLGGDDPVSLTAGMLLFSLIAVLLVYKQFLKPAMLNDNTIG
jgi:hypothetical protein